VEVVAQIRSHLGKISSFVILFLVPLFLACKISDQQLRLIPMDSGEVVTLLSRVFRIITRPFSDFELEVPVSKYTNGVHLLLVFSCH